MKKTLIYALCLSGFNVGYSKVYTNKHHRGLFGYKNVEQTTMNNGDIFLNCNDPGRTACKVQQAITWPNGGPVLTVEIADLIDKKIGEEITNSNIKGAFVFNETFFVTFSYDEERDIIQSVIYSIDEARKEKLI